MNVTEQILKAVSLALRAEAEVNAHDEADADVFHDAADALDDALDLLKAQGQL